MINNNINRRGMLCLAASVAALGVSFPFFSRMAAAQSKTPSPLLQKPILEDIVIGSPDAPVSVIEYMSLTCIHCASFQTDVMPELKKRYIDSDKVRVIIREFPLDPLATAAAMVVRCLPKDGQYPFIGALLNHQKQWVTAENPSDALFQLAKQAGINKKTFNECLEDQELLKALRDSRDTVANDLGVSGTPTFFINGVMMEDVPTVENFAAIIEPLLK